MSDIRFTKTTEDLYCPHCKEKIEEVIAKPVITQMLKIQTPATWLLACSKCKKVLSNLGSFG